jgi:hypothetical protein
MIIPFQRGNSLEEYLREEQGPTPDLICPICSSRLWAHGKRSRVAENLTMCVLIEIVRKLCSGCNRTFSLLPDFLESGKRFAREVAEEYVAALFFEDSTYRGIAWSDMDGEREDASASLSRACRAVAYAADAAPALLLAAQQELLLSGESFEEYECEFRQYRVVGTARTGQKARLLKVLGVLLLILERKVGKVRQAICAAYRRLRLDFWFPTPHAMKQKLF